MNNDLTKDVFGSQELIENIFEISSRLYSEMCTNKETDHGTLFKYMTELGRTMVDADRASFWKWDKRRHELWTTSATGVDRIVIPDNTGLVGKALKEGRVIVTNDPYNDPDFNKAVDLKTGYVTKSILTMPVADINGVFIGAFQIINKNGDKGFDETEDVRRLSLAAVISGLAMESESFLEESHHDKLTKLKNRMGFYSDFSRKYSKAIEDNKAISLFISDMPLGNVEEVTIEPISESGLFELEGCAFRELEDYGFQWVHFETAGLNEDANPILKVNAGFFGYSVILDVIVDEFDEAYRTGDMEAIGNFPIKYVEADDISEDIVNPMYNADGTLKIEEDVVSEDFGK